jgi:hypothetical protein|tara:strand:+ start:7440 stop:7796 length:357 start_codon:yes stop_codon:yes gene_type:complete
MGALESTYRKGLAIVAGRVNADHTAITAGEGFQITDTDAGDTLLTFDRAYDKLISIVATSETAGTTLQVGTVTIPAEEAEGEDGTIGATIQILGFQSEDEDAAEDCAFSFITVWEIDT